jgi:capsular polysaccharide biosynthesis protein
LEEINLYELLRYYSKKWIIIVLFIIIGLIGGIIYNQFVQVPKYTSNATLLLVDIMDSFRVEIKKLYNLDNIQIVDNASTPSSPSNIHTTAQLVVAALIGLIMSIIVVFFMYDYVINNRNTHKSISKKSSATIVTPDRAKKISKTRSKKSTLKKKVNSKKK